MVNLPRWAYSTAWVIWIVWFFTWEVLAVLDKGENETLSGHFKQLMWQGNGRPTAVAFLVAPGLLWILWHFYDEIRTHWTT